MRSDYKVSFIIPFHDVLVEQLLECIESVLSQGISRYEVLLIDDGSTNQDLIKECQNASKTNKNIRYLRQDNLGAAAARNKGLDEADGDWIVFVDADDKLRRSFLSKVSKHLYSDVDLIIFDYNLWDRKKYKRKTLKKNLNLEKDRKDILANIMFYPGKMNDFMFGSIWAKCFSRSFLKKNSIRFADQLRKAQDRRFMADVFSAVNRVSYSPSIMYYYRINERSITHRLDWSMEEYYKRLSNSFEKFCKENKVDFWISKFLNYSIFLELLPLTVCHADADLRYEEKRLVYKRMYKFFGIRNESRRIRYKDVPSFRGKVKLMFIRGRLFWPVYIIFRTKSRMEEQSIFKDEGDKRC